MGFVMNRLSNPKLANTITNLLGVIGHLRDILHVLLEAGAQHLGARVSNVVTETSKSKSPTCTSVPDDHLQH